MSDCIAWDIGGAHLKVARVGPDGTVASAAQFLCPLWRGIDELHKVFPEVCRTIGQKIGQTIGESGCHAVTMTGEMADCFADRREGVQEIVRAMAALLQKPFWVYAGAEGFLDSEIVLHQPEKAAAMNWHATAACLSKLTEEFSARVSNQVSNQVSDRGLLMDIGTTTTDIIPFAKGQVLECGVTDSERLIFGSLVYTGAVRTPLMAIAETVQVGEVVLPMVAEQFAVAADIYCLSGDLSADDILYPSCDGADASPDSCARRLARMFACDYDGNMEFWEQVAMQIAQKQMQKITAACKKICRAVGFESEVSLLGAGTGHFIARKLADTALGGGAVRYQDAAAHLGLNRHSPNCVSAVSLARLLHDHLKSQ